MKKVAISIICTLCLLSLVACGSSNVETNDVSSSGLFSDADEALSDEDTSINETIIEEETEETETMEITTNGYTYSVPTAWKVDSETNEMTKFLVDEDETHIVLVQAKDIPEIMKIDTGSGSAILTKEDVAEYFLLDNYEISSEEWKSDLGFDYYDAYFNISDGRVGRIVVVPINETEAGFSVTILVNDEEYLQNIDICISSLELSSESENESALSETETYYNLCMNLTKDDCTKDSLGLYSYNGITFMSDDSEWMESPLNSDGSINASAFYMKLQSCLANFSIGNSWESYAEHIVGYMPSSRDEFAPYVDEYLTYMTDSYFGNSMMAKFQTMDSVEEFQEDTTYICTIADVSECAEELNISEEMLGYIMGALHDCGATITFNGSECIIEYTDIF